MKVKNTNAHRAADKEYFFATHVKSDAKPGEDDVVMLLLTDKELERASKRAEKNKEDLPEYFAIIQGSVEPTAMNFVKEEPVCLDDKDAAKPAESKGFFGWLMGD